MKINIAIDGPSGVGKSSLSKDLAQKFNLVFLNTGMMYRAIAFYYLKIKNDINEEFINKSINDLKINILSDNEILVNGENYSKQLWSDEISITASEIAKYEKVRNYCLQLQQDISKNGGYILEGRDIGTVILPNADLKFFLIANPLVRAERRIKQMKEKNIVFNEQEIIDNILKRDFEDENRKLNPLTPALDAIVIDTTNLDFEQVKEKMIKEIEKKLN
ncbi:MAG: (d)CMP kinase [Metamycoplasmataceae bacterium]